MFKHLSLNSISITYPCVMKKDYCRLRIQNFIPSHDNSISFWQTSNKFLINSPNGSTPATALDLSTVATGFGTQLCESYMVNENKN